MVCNYHIIVLRASYSLSYFFLIKARLEGIDYDGHWPKLAVTIQVVYTELSENISLQIYIYKIPHTFVP